MFGKAKTGAGDERAASAKIPPLKPFVAPAAPQPPAVITRPAARQAESSRTMAGVGRRMVVGREITLSGEIKACQKLIVGGQVTAEITDAESLEITETGHFKGCAVVGDCEVSGTFEGDLTVGGLLRLRSSGRVSGKIRYAEVEIERGGRLTGDVDLRRTPEVKAAVKSAPEATPPEAPHGDGDPRPGAAEPLPEPGPGPGLRLR